MYDFSISIIIIHIIFLVLGLFPSVLAYFIVKKIKKKNKTAIVIAIFIALIDFFTYTLLKLSITDLLIYHFLLVLATIPPLLSFFIVKSITKNNKPSITISLIIFMCICSLIFIDYYTISNSIIILNRSDKNIYINKVYIMRQIIFQGKYTLAPSDKNKLWSQDGALNKKYDITRNIHEHGAILNIEFNDGDIDQKSSVQLIDEKKSGCIFYIYYKGNNEFSAVCNSLYIDPTW